MLIHLETSPLSVENFLFFFSFFFFLLLGGFKVLAKRAFQKSGDAFQRKSKERIQRSTTSRLSTLFLKQSRKEKKSRDERRHESVMDRERVKEETASRGDRERDRGRQERERETEGGKRERERQRGRQRDRETREKKERKKREISLFCATLSFFL